MLDDPLTSGVMSDDISTPPSDVEHDDTLTTRDVEHDGLPTPSDVEPYDLPTCISDAKPDDDPPQVILSLKIYSPSEMLNLLPYYFVPAKHVVLLMELNHSHYCHPGKSCCNIETVNHK